MRMRLCTSVLLLQGDTKRDSGAKDRYFVVLLFGSSALPEVAVVGSVVSVDHGIALTQLVVVAGFPVDLVGRLVALPDPGEWRKRPRMKGSQKGRKGLVGTEWNPSPNTKECLKNRHVLPSREQVLF